MRRWGEDVTACASAVKSSARACALHVVAAGALVRDGVGSSSDRVDCTRASASHASGAWSLRRARGNRASGARSVCRVFRHCASAASGSRRALRSRAAARTRRALGAASRPAVVGRWSAAGADCAAAAVVVCAAADGDSAARASYASVVTERSAARANCGCAERDSSGAAGTRRRDGSVLTGNRDHAPLHIPRAREQPLCQGGWPFRQETKFLAFRR